MRDTDPDMPSTAPERRPVASAARARRVAAYRPARPHAPVDLWLDANEGPRDDARLAAILESLDADTVRRYPDASALERRIAESRGVAPERVLVTAGGDDAINRLCLAMLEPGRTLLQHTPTFSMIEHSATLAGAEVRSVPWMRGPFPADGFLERIGEDVAVAAVVSPNNPTGGAVALDDLRRVAERAAERGAVAMIDLAYAEFADEDPTERLLGLDNVVLIRTLSKAWSMAGLRVGYMIGPPDVVEWCRAVGGPFPVSGVSLAVIAALLRRATSPDSGVIERIRSERERLTGALRAAGASPIDSQANFILAEFGSPERAVWTRDALAGLGIWTRAFGAPDLAHTLRITCPGDEAHSERLLHALDAALRPEAMLFDLDGVIADVSRSYRLAIEKTVASFGGRAGAADVAEAKRAGDANNDWILSHRLLAAQGIDAPLEEVTARFESIYQGGAPGSASGESGDGLWRTEGMILSRDVLEATRRALPIGVVTGRPRRDARRFLEHHGIAGLVDALVCMEDGPAKPRPDVVRTALERLGVRRAWMVGDTVDDVRAARGAGVVPIGVIAPGDDRARTSRALLDAGAARILDDPRDILELLP